MPRKRMIDPAIWPDGNFARLSFGARLLFIGLITLADDGGCGDADPFKLRLSIFPANQDVGEKEILNWLKDMADPGMIELRSTENCGREVTLYKLPGWDRYQKLRADYTRDLSFANRYDAVTDPARTRNGPVTDPARTRTASKSSKSSKLNIKTQAHKNSAPAVKPKKRIRRPDIDVVLKALKKHKHKNVTEKTVQHIINACRGRIHPVDLIDRGHQEDIRDPEKFILGVAHHPDRYMGREGIRSWAVFVDETDPRQPTSIGDILDGAGKRDD